MGSSPRQKLLILAFAASPLSMQHYGVRAKTGWHRIMIMSMSGCHVSMSGYHMSMRGCHMSMSGCHVSMSGCHMSMRGCHMSMSGCHMSMSGCHMSTRGLFFVKIMNLCRGLQIWLVLYVHNMSNA